MLSEIRHKDMDKFSIIEFITVAVIPVAMMIILFIGIVMDSNILCALFGVLGIVLLGCIVYIEEKR